MKTRRLLSVFLVLAMMTALCPSASFADEIDDAVTINENTEYNEHIGDDSASTSEGGGMSDSLTTTPVDMETSDETSENVGNDENVEMLEAGYGNAEESGTDQLSTKLVNGSFEWPVIPSSKIEKQSWYVVPEKTMRSDAKKQGHEFGWKTTEMTGPYNFEFSSFLCPVLSSYTKGKKIVRTENVTNGDQFAELCARDQSSIYQNIRTESGEILEWGLSHRARQMKGGDWNDYYDQHKSMTGKTLGELSYEYTGIKASEQTDIMALFIGPAQSEDYKKKGQTRPYAAENDAASRYYYDIFMWMAYVLNLTDGIVPARGDKSAIGMSDEYIIYAKENIDATQVTPDNYEQYFSKVKSRDYPQEWHCRIITDGGDWNRYTGTYEVPYGQEATTLAFTALSGDVDRSNKYNNQGGILEGNLLDNITLETKYPLVVKTTTNGSGSVSIKEDETASLSDASDSDKISVTHDSPYSNTYTDGTEVDISAEPDSSNAKFLGAYINGVFYDSSDASKFTKTESGNYTLNPIIMNQSQYVHLIFTEASTVIYDPNGGTYGGKTENTKIVMGKEGSGVFSTHDNSSYDTDGKAKWVDGRHRFYGWLFARAKTAENTNTDTSAIITGDHTVNYISNDSAEDELSVNFNVLGDTTTYSRTVPAGTGLTFIAQWQYLQEAVALTKGATDAEYKESGTGGSVELNINNGATDQDSTSTVTDRRLFGLLSDSVAMTATANAGYTFLGWYTEPNGGKRITTSNIYAYSITEPVIAYARFSAYTQYPYLSFVSQSTDAIGSSELKNTPFSIGSHIKVNDQVVSEFKKKGNISYNHLGNEVYGNTISTGFVVNTVNTSNLSSQYCTWQIDIPLDKGIYIKNKDSILSGNKDITLADKPLLTDKIDEGSSIYNQGGIYKVTSVGNGKNTLTLRMTDKLPQVSGAAAISYGLVIDNLYAPGAQAAIVLSGQKPDESEIDLDISDSLHAAGFDDYVKNSPYEAK